VCAVDLGDFLVRVLLYRGWCDGKRGMGGGRLGNERDREERNTLIIAFLTTSLFIKPFLNRLSINSLFVLPPLRQAMVGVDTSPRERERRNARRGDSVVDFGALCFSL
jgi:hypothetical protein